MPHRNRVDPFGNLIARPARGSLFGNRGVLHDAEGNIVRRHQLKRWIYCRLEFKGRRRELLQPGRYTELFFLDEATALAAGHRPCAECLRERFNEFRAAWGGDRRVSAPELDAVLHSERLTDGGEQATFAARLGDLPDGAMVVTGSGQPELLWAARCGVGSRAATPAHGPRSRRKPCGSSPRDQPSPQSRPGSAQRLVAFEFHPSDVRRSEARGGVRTSARSGGGSRVSCRRGP